MPTVRSVAAFLENFAPSRLAEDWDNVGLLVGDYDREVRRVMTCLTVTPESANEAVRREADLIVTHHPLPFKPLRRLTTDCPEGRLLWKLMGAQVSLYSPHTAFDSALEGINQRLAAGLGLQDIQPLVPLEDDTLGAGRVGNYSSPLTLAEVGERLKSFLELERIQRVTEADREVRRVAVACGAAGSFLEAAWAADCDCFVTGETRFHTCLEAEARGVGMLLVGHFASERFAVEELAARVAAEFPDAQVWASENEYDPLQWQ